MPQVPPPAGYTTRLQRLLQPGQPVEAAHSPGEALIPYFLLAGEACWINALLIGLAGVDFLHTGTALLPFWGPPLLFAAALWLFQRVLHQEAVTTEDNASPPLHSGAGTAVSLFLTVPVILACGLVWLRIYAGTYFLLDPRWLLSWLNDLFALNDHFFQALAILLLAGYFCWRATRLAQMHIEPSQVRRQMWVGLLFLAGALLLRAGQGGNDGNGDDIVLVFLIPVFFYCTLSAHALARLSFVRRSHPFGLEGRVSDQERALLSVVGAMGLLLLMITLLGGFFFSTAFFNSLQPAWREVAAAYDWLARALSLAVAWLLSPIFSFFSWLNAHVQHSTRTTAQGLPKLRPATYPMIVSYTTNTTAVIKTILPFLLLLGLILLLARALRRRQRLTIRRRKASDEVHESVWSWSLFWQQLRALLATLFRLSKAATESEQSSAGDDNPPVEPAAWTVRLIYRALLAKATTLGYPRRRDETPREFQHRLNQSLATGNEPQLDQITTAYSLTRYAGTMPDEQELARVRDAWDELQRGWNAK